MVIFFLVISIYKLLVSILFFVPDSYVHTDAQTYAMDID